MIHRRDLLALAACGVGTGIIGARPVFAQERPFRILMLTFNGETEVERGFRDYLTDFGVRTEVIVRKVGRTQSDVAPVLSTLPEIAPDLIYTRGASMTLAVVGPYDAPNPADYVRDRPVVFALVAAPVQAKIVRSLERPGGNVTGAMHVVPVPVQLRAMQSYRPFKKVGALYSPTEQNAAAVVEQVREHLTAIGAELITRNFQTGPDGMPIADGVDVLVNELKAAGVDWIYLVPDTFGSTVLARISPPALAAGLPMFGATEMAVRQGGALVGLVSRYYAVGQLAGAKAMEILVARTPVRDIPVGTLKRFSLIININIAKKLGIYPPIEMLNYAEVVTS
ncbi:ABC transporter substrate-binding protein [Starkeya sp. ORNL1]|uniref:ABC transporter substrate-binding protein n=1 Tax=Starkeya sp. ORNL1 TaxID=2709380 RepID=UPI0014633398|nr:ABC transporter substrate-binding protein [Starkeya sp. ORNL1]QJP14004.1 ABC transporter substrate-binding protein [Starkeya sp. ORNL1]